MSENFLKSQTEPTPWTPTASEAWTASHGALSGEVAHAVTLVTLGTWHDDSGETDSTQLSPPHSLLLHPACWEICKTKAFFQKSQVKFLDHLEIYNGKCRVYVGFQGKCSKPKLKAIQLVKTLLMSDRFWNKKIFFFCMSNNPFPWPSTFINYNTIVCKGYGDLRQ